MAYTTQQLVDIYTRANAGAAPSAATRLTLDAYAQQTQPGGGLSEQAALNQTLTLVNNTTAVAFATYQFFNGAAPSAAGIEFLLNSSANANDLNDATGVYGSFNQESRFINFSVNLALGGTSASSFATSYGQPVTYRDTVASAYDKIIGNSVAAAAGNDVNAAVNWFSRQANIDALTSFVRANNPTFTATQIDLAVKAALIGQILSTAVTTGLGIYAGAVRAAVTDLSDDGALTGNTADGLNIVAAYPGAGGGVVGKSFALTGDIDNLVGTSNDDTFSGSVGGAVNTVNNLDAIDGGAGVDTLNLADATGATLDTANLSVKNVEIVNLTAAPGGLANQALDTTAWTGLTNANVTLQAPGSAQTITAASGTAVKLTSATNGTADLTVNGGSSVTVTTAGSGAGADITVGSTTAAPTGVVTINAQLADAGTSFVGGAIAVTGGTTVSVTQSVKAPSPATVAPHTITQGAVTVTGTASTTAVTVNQAKVQAAVSNNENYTGTFSALAAGGSVTFGGLTYTSTGAQSAAAVAAAFANLAAGATTGAGAGTGTYTGALSGLYTTGAVTGTSSVTAIASATGDQADLTSSLTGTAFVKVEAGNGAGGIATGAVTIVDANYGKTAGGTITSVTLANGAQTVSANALATLNLSGDNNVTVNLESTNSKVSKALAINLAGGTSTVNDAADVLTSATITSTTASSVKFDADSLKTLNVAGSKVTTLDTTSSLTGLTTVNVAGAGGLTADFGASTTVKTVDTTASTGKNTVTINGTVENIAFIGGAGADTVRLAGALKDNGSIKLGAGNDRLLSDATTAGVISASDVVDGGDGVDAISSALISATNAAVFKNFEVLNLGSGGGDLVDVSLLTGSTITTLELNGGPGGATYSHIGLAQALSVTGGSTGTVTLSFDGVSGSADAYGITFNASVTGTTASPTTVAAGTVATSGVEIINIASGSAAGVAKNTITLSDVDANKLVITGSQAIQVGFSTFGTATAATGVNIDASAATGAVTFTSLTGIKTVDGGSTIVTGSGADSITVGAITGQVNLTTGGGKDVIDVSTTTGLFGATPATNAAHVTITDFSSTDTLRFANNGTETFVSAKIDLTGVNDFVSAVNASVDNGASVGVISWFQYGGNTYVVQDNTAGNGDFGAADIVVKLTGLVDLSSAVLSGTTGTTGPSFTLV